MRQNWGRTTHQVTSLATQALGLSAAGRLLTTMSSLIHYRWVWSVVSEQVVSWLWTYRCWQFAFNVRLIKLCLKSTYIIVVVILFVKYYTNLVVCLLIP